MAVAQANGTGHSWKHWWRQFRAGNTGPTEGQSFLVLTLISDAVVGLTIVVLVALTESLGGRLLAASPLERVLSPFIGSGRVAAGGNHG